MTSLWHPQAQHVSRPPVRPENTTAYSIAVGRPLRGVQLWLSTLLKTAPNLARVVIAPSHQNPETYAWCQDVAAHHPKVRVVEIDPPPPVWSAYLNLAEHYVETSYALALHDDVCWRREGWFELMARELVEPTVAVGMEVAAHVCAGHLYPTALKHFCVLLHYPSWVSLGCRWMGFRGPVPESVLLPAQRPSQEQWDAAGLDRTKHLVLRDTEFFYTAALLNGGTRYRPFPEDCIVTGGVIANIPHDAHIVHYGCNWATIPEFNCRKLPPGFRSVEHFSDVRAKLIDRDIRFVLAQWGDDPIFKELGLV